MIVPLTTPLVCFKPGWVLVWSKRSPLPICSHYLHSLYVAPSPNCILWASRAGTQSHHLRYSVSESIPNVKSRSQVYSHPLLRTSSTPFRTNSIFVVWWAFPICKPQSVQGFLWNTCFFCCVVVQVGACGSWSHKKPTKVNSTYFHPGHPPGMSTAHRKTKLKMFKPWFLVLGGKKRSLSCQCMAYNLFWQYN